MPDVVEVFVKTNKVIERNFTNDEQAQRALDATAAADKEQAAADAVAARESALAKLAGLGLTPDEIAALVGA
jgi:hypothetical protein